MAEIQTYNATIAERFAWAGHEVFIAHPDGEKDKMEHPLDVRENAGHLFVMEVEGTVTV
jgi:H2-forming N5,N10-methylenetetrahydromethanopterin dehydrogenase-like enzyme